MKTEIDYSEFLFYNIIHSRETIHPLKSLPYDLAFGEIPSYHQQYLDSKFNTDLKSEYDCINDYLDYYDIEIK